MNRILVVEDDLPVRLGLQYIFEDAGYEVQLARDSQEALQSLGKSDYDVAIVDLRMPDEVGRFDDDAGIKLLKCMEEKYAALPVIVLTVRDDPEAMQACKQLRNVNEYLVKDPDPSRLKELVKKILGDKSSRSDIGGANGS